MYQKPKRPNAKKHKADKRQRNALYWKTGGRQVLTAPTNCKPCIKLQKLDRDKKQKEDPAPHGQVWRLNRSIRCEPCQKSYEESFKKTSPKDEATKQSNS